MKRDWHLRSGSPVDWVEKDRVARFFIRWVEREAPRNLRHLTSKSLIWALALLMSGIAIEALQTGRPVQEVSLWAASASVIVGVPCVVAAFMIMMHQYRLQKSLENLAYTDLLTGLPNRRAFMTEAARRLAEPGQIELMILDLDHFKRINDKYGHEVGDLCLRQFAQFLADQIRQEDFPARIGGEEFALLVSDASGQDAMHVGDRLSAGLVADHAGIDLPITASVGVTEPQKGEELTAVLRRADTALYQAKAEGRARAVRAEPGDDPKEDDIGKGVA